MKRVLVAFATGAVVVALAVPASAHVTVQPNEAIAESFSKFVVRVPNEQEDASTVKIQVELPPLAFTSFQDVAGWERKVKTVKFDEPLEAFGSEITEGVGTVTWTGGEIQPGEFAEFPFSAAMPAGEAVLEFPAIQTYDNGDVVEWTGPEDADEPAGTVSTVEFGDIAEEGAGQLEVLHEVVHELEELNETVAGLEEASAGSETEAADDDAEDDDDSDTLPLILGALGAGLGAIALIVALSKKKA